MAKEGLSGIEVACFDCPEESGKGGDGDGNDAGDVEDEGR